MEGFEIDNALESMVALIDTREQPSQRATKRYESFGCPYERQKLDYCDYSVKFLLNGEWQQLKVGIERKMNLDELAGCFTHDRDRFKREFERAKADGATVYLLVENATWEGLVNGRYRSKFNPNAFLASITSWMVRYNIKPIFCKEETSGKLIAEILKRELKDALERGAYG